jgi:RNA polymerase sigma factor (TIGR02999 family)
MPLAEDLTERLRCWAAGDPKALNEIVAATYDELHAVAVAHLMRENRAHTLQATALVHELYIRLAQARHAQFSDRKHFFAFAARLMRLVLIDYARRSKAAKRHGGARSIPFHEELPWISAEREDMIALDQALDRLEREDARKVQAIELRYFLGCTNEEAAELLGISRPTVDRDLEFAKAWLYRQLRS